MRRVPPSVIIPLVTYITIGNILFEIVPDACVLQASVAVYVDVSRSQGCLADELL